MLSKSHFPDKTMINSTRKLCSLLRGGKCLDKHQVIFGGGPNTTKSSSASLMKPTLSYPAEEGCSKLDGSRAFFRKTPELVGL